MNNKGFSLLELLIYLAIIAILSVVLVAAFVSINKGRGNIMARTTVDSNLRVAVEKMEQDLHSASAVLTPSSVVGSSSTLVLLVGGSTITYDAPSGSLRRKVGSNSPDTITDSSVLVNTTTVPLLFTRFENYNLVFATSSVSVQIQLNLQYNSQSPDYQYNETKRTTLLLRKL